MSKNSMAFKFWFYGNSLNKNKNSVECKKVKISEIVIMKYFKIEFIIFSVN
jgi:hypothetical protein